MIKNNKGSGLTWAVMIVMILLLIIGASLTFAYSSYKECFRFTYKSNW